MTPVQIRLLHCVAFSHLENDSIFCYQSGLVNRIFGYRPILVAYPFRKKAGSISQKNNCTVYAQLAQYKTAQCLFFFGLFMLLLLVYGASFLLNGVTHICIVTHSCIFFACKILYCINFDQKYTFLAAKWKLLFTFD